MIKDEKFLILSAESTHLIIQLEKNLLGKNIPCRVIPLPTEISANCGLAVRVETEYTDEIKKIVEDEKITISQAREILNVKRAAALMILEKLDELKITKRINDYRILEKESKL